jgi:cell division protein FtsN
MLPLVGIIAIVLLVVAGKFFFLSGAGEGQPPLPRLEESSHVSTRGNRAQAEEIITERQKDAPVPNDSAASSSANSSPVVVSPVPSNREESRPALTELNLWAVPYDGKAPSASTSSQGAAVATPRTTPVAGSSTTTSNSGSRPVVVVRPVTPAPPQTTGRTAQTAPSAESPTPPPAKPSWMVQVGAFSTQGAANTVSQQVTKAGYSATVVPGKNLHRVLVQAGSTREEALTLATRMSQIGFKGAFIVPPR